MHPHALAAAAARHPARPAAALRALGAQERDLAVLVPLVRQIREIRAARAANKPRHILSTRFYARVFEPAGLHWALTVYRDAKARARREQAALDAAKRLRWRSDRAAEAVRAYAMLGDHHEAVLATLEAIAREARRRGWEVRYTSHSSSGRASSRYVEIPGVGSARVSDHLLPPSPRRDEMGVSWRGEVIVDHDCLAPYASLARYMRAVLLAAAGRR